MSKSHIIAAFLFIVTPLMAETSNTRLITGDLFSQDLKICERCKKEGKKSRVYQGGMTSYAVYCGDGYWDEDGHYVSPGPCGGGETYFSCSNGHKWKEAIWGGETSTIWFDEEKPGE